MKYLKSYKLFESRFVEFRELISTINDICQEFIDHNCSCCIFPQDDIKLNIVSLKSRGHLGSISQPFYLEIDIDRRIIVSNEKRSEFGPFPEWFIDNCRRVEDFMKAEGFETKPSVRYGTDWENLDSIDELSEVIGLIYKVRLEFFPIDNAVKESVELDNLDYTIIDEMKDILLPFSDMDMEVTCDYITDGHGIDFNVMGQKEKAFDINDYKSDIDALISYMKEKNWVILNFNLGIVKEMHDWSGTVFVARSQNILSYPNGPLRYEVVKKPVFWITGEFRKINYAKVKQVKESLHSQVMVHKYGQSILDECDSMISDIKDMLLELQDIDLFVMVGYTPMTLTSRDDTPKIMAEVQGDSLMCSYIEDDIDAAFERVKEYASSNGYVTGFGTWERDVDGGKKMSVYQILIQK